MTTYHAAIGLHFVDKNFVILFAEVLAAEQGPHNGSQQLNLTNR